ncbi:MAG: hypothetical protein JXB04_02300 [Kiritimatiellae bacterium]|nr:hypothetical protein [Kiritimatiellia bacterium]
MRKFGAVLVLVLAAGCGEVVIEDEDVEAMKQERRLEQEPAAPARLPAAMDDAVDTVVTRKGTISAGRRTADKVRQIGAEREEDFREAGAE